MKVKIGNKIYDSSEEPIMIILSDDDKFNISHMRKEDTKYLSYPDKMSIEKAKKFMEIGG